MATRPCRAKTHSRRLSARLSRPVRALPRILAAGAVGLVMMAFFGISAAGAGPGAGAVSSVTVTVGTPVSDASSAQYTISFKTPSAVPASGLITVVAPGGTFWSDTPCDYSLVDLTTPSASFSCPTVQPTVKVAESGLPFHAFNNHSGAAFSLDVVDAIKAGDSLKMVVSGVVNPGPGTYTLSVFTSSDLTPAVSAGYQIGAGTSVGPPSVTLNAPSAGDHAVTYDVRFTATHAIPSGGTVNVVGPPGSVWAPLYQSCDFAVLDLTRPANSMQCPTNGPSLEIGDDGGYTYGWNGRTGVAATLTTVSPIHAGDHVEVVLTGAINPSPGRYRLSVSTSSDPVSAFSNYYTIGAVSALAAPSVAVSYPAGPATGVTYVVNATLGHSLPVGATISLLASAGTTWSPSVQYAVDDLTHPAASFAQGDQTIAATGQLLTITVPATNTENVPETGLAAGDRAQVTATNVAAPAGPGQTVLMATSNDPVWVTSAPFAVRATKLAAPTGPGGSVGDSSLVLSTSVAGADGVTTSMAFTVGAALTAGQGTITLVGPPGAVFGGCNYGCGPSGVAGNNPTYTITDDTTSSGSANVATGISVSADSRATTITVPNTVKAGDHVVVSVTQCLNGPTGPERFMVFTSSDPTPVTVTADLTAESAVGSPTLSMSSPAAYATGVQYTVSFTTSGVLLAGLGTVSVIAPPGTVFGECPYGCGSGNPTITVTDPRHPAANGLVGADYLGSGASTLSFMVPNTVPSGDHVSVSITEVTNPPAGDSELSVRTSADPLPAAVPDDIVPAAMVLSPSLKVVAPPVGQTVPAVASASPGTVPRDVLATLTTSGHGQLLAGLGGITFITPGTDLAAASTVTLTDLTHPVADGGLAGESAIGSGTINSFLVPGTVVGGDKLTVEFFGVPLASGDHVGSGLTAQIVTSSDPVLTGVSATQPKVNSISRSLLPLSVAFKPTAVIVNAAITVGLVLFITFPAALFNQTFSENYADIVAWWRRWTETLLPSGAQRRVSLWAHGGQLAAAGTAEVASAEVAAAVPRPAVPQTEEDAGTPASREGLEFAAVVLLGAFLGSMLDPAFGANVRTLTSFAGILLSTLAGVVVSGFVTTSYHRARRHGPVPYRLHALPLGLLVAAVCVLVSRATGFEPGYLYGVVAGVKFSRDLAKPEEGHLVAIGSLVTITLAIVAWLGWDYLNPLASKPGAFFGGVVADDFLSALFVGGLVGTVISLLPLRFLPGHKLQAWHRGAWAATFGIALFLLVDAVLRPDSHVVGRSHAPLITAVLLFVLFGGGSLVFRQHFARKHAHDDEQDAAPTSGEDTGPVLTAHR